MIDENNLSAPQVEWCLRTKKIFLLKDQLRQFNRQLKTSFGTSFKLDLDVYTNPNEAALYTLHFRQKIVPNVNSPYSMHLRFKESNIHLARLDVDGFHKNPDGSYVRGRGHMHIYTPSTNRHDAFALELDHQYFSDVDDVYNTWREFLLWLNIEV